MSLCNLDPLTENYDVHFYIEYMARWPSLFTIAENSDGQIIGYIMGKVEEDPAYLSFSDNYLPWHGHVTALTVAPQYRRLGIAKLLTEAFERACENQNAWFVDLFVRASNDRAITMYRKMGDNPTSKSAGEDAFDMRKPMRRDKKRKHIRENGEEYRVNPEDIYHG
ncbi:N(alpha)-acetyltransferase 20, NatB catalytic subunit [Xylographa soralifera]|nr:N(alpha)-acetyltransferase 20, NatB catalytic subunit [Xylographa soralifera]